MRRTTVPEGLVGSCKDAKSVRWQAELGRDRGTDRGDDSLIVLEE